MFSLLNGFSGVGKIVRQVRPCVKRYFTVRQVPHLRYLNFYLLSLVLVSSTNGHDGSLMNGLQALPERQEFMDKLTGA